MDEEGILQLMILYWLKKRRFKRRRYWVHKFHQCRSTYGEYHHLMEQVLSDDEKCLSYIRMKSSTFKRLLAKVGPFLQKRTTNFRKPLLPEERLVITLCYLAHGESHVSLPFHFRAGVSTVRSIIRETCIVLWEVLQKESITVMPVPTNNNGSRIAADFNARFHFPNCLGAIDGKHIRIRKPNNSGSKFYNYKEYFSIILLAVTDANGKFVIINVGSCGGNSNGGVFSRSIFGKRLNDGNLDLPNETVIPENDIKLPFVFVADDAFLLHDNIVKPFPHRQLTPDKEAFNYRLSRSTKKLKWPKSILELGHYGNNIFSENGLALFVNVNTSILCTMIRRILNG